MFQVLSSPQAFARRVWLCLSFSLLAVLGSSVAHAQALIAPQITSVYTTIPSPATQALPEYANPNPSTNNGNNFYSVTWLDKSSNEDFYELEIQVLDSTHQNANNFTWFHYAYLAPNTTQYFPVFSLLKGNVTGTPVQFRVSACRGPVDSNGNVGTPTERARSDSFVPYTATADANFAGPTNLQVSLVPGSDGRLHFDWNDNTNKEEGYQLFVYSTSAPNTNPTGDPKAVFNFGHSPPDTAISGLTAGSTFYMRLCAYQVHEYKTSGGAIVRDSNNQAVPLSYDTSAFSNEVSITMPSTLQAPTGLTATPLSENKLRLSWTNHSDNADSYSVQYRYRSTDSFSELGSTGVTQTVDVPGYPGVPTEWQVVAAQAQQGSIPAHSSAGSNSATITLPFNPPTNFNASFDTDPSTLHLVLKMTWADNSLVESGYALLAKVHGSSSDAQVVGTVPTANATSGQIDVSSALDPGTSYDLSVAAYDANSNQLSGSSNTVTLSYDGITSLEYAPIAYKESFAPYQMTITSAGTFKSWSITGLPAGLTFSSATGAVTQTNIDGAVGPQESGLFLCPMTVTYTNGWSHHKTLALRVVRSPASPVMPLQLTTRTVKPGVTSLPLSELFSDPDTEAAVRLDTTQGNIDMVLQPTLTPATYANFMAYTNAGDYNGTVFHRVSPDFVLQGGGYKPVPLSDTVTTKDVFKEVTQRPSPVNEPGITNLRGTVALAKGSTPNSGTHDFFISLDDNDASLDNQVGGFTVFGRVAKLTPLSSTPTSPPPVTPVIDSFMTLPGSNAYSVKLIPSGQTTVTQSAFNPVSGGDSGLGTGTLWPSTEAPLLDAQSLPIMDNTKCILINNVTPLSVLTYSTPTSSDPGNVEATIVGNNLQINGKVELGTATISLTATDVDGNTVTQTFDVTVDSSYNGVQIVAAGDQPQDLSVNEGQSASFHVAAIGDGLHYQWRKKGVNIQSPSATTATLQLPDPSSANAASGVHAADAADYQVVVYNNSDIILSSSAHLTVKLAPTITTQPLAATVNYGSPVTFSVVAAGEPTLSYQWYKGTDAINGATSASYTIAKPLLTDAGSYKVQVTNSVNNVTSESVALVVNRIDTDGDGLYDDEEVAQGLLANKADTDGDGYSDSLELSLGTDPRVASSSPGTQYFVAQKDKAAALATLTMKNIPQALNFINFLVDKPGDTTQAVTVPQQWMATTEMTNEQFASALEIGMHQMNSIEIVSSGGRRYVRYPKTTGEILCYLAPLPSATAASNSPPSCDIGADSTGNTFYVSKALARKPVRAVSWYGAYFASAALNAYYGYPDKCQPGWTYNSTLSVKGYRIPRYADWEWAADSGAAKYVYPTGASVTTAQANYGNTTAVAGPKIVGSYAPNKLGLYDMGGNVAEWIYEQTTIPFSGYVRGGSFASPSTELKNLSAVAEPRETISDKVGVRLTLTEDTVPRILTPPADQFVRVGDAVTISVSAAGPPPLTYQWLKNNVVMAGKTSSTLSIPAAQLTDAANYTVKIVTNGAGSITSAPGGLSVLNSPASVPLTVVLPGKTATLSVAMAAAPTQVFTYQWFKVSGATRTKIEGARAAKLVMPAVTSANTSSYVCEVTPPTNKQPALQAASVSMDLIVLKAPALSGNPATVTLATGVVGGYYSLNIFSNLFDTSTDRAPTSFVIKGLPPGLTYDPKTGLIYGRPTTVGQSTGITITAINGVGSVTVGAVIQLEVKPMPAAAKGTFVAGVDPQSVLNNNLGGRLDFTTSTTGYYTGKLTLGGTPYSITGYLGATVTTTNSVSTVSTSASTSILIPRTGKNSLLLDVTADFSSESRSLSGTVGELVTGTSTVINSAAVVGWRSLDYSGATATSVGRKGLHTMVFGPPASSTDATLVPQGNSFVTASVADTGVVTLGGKLADGTGITGSCVMSSGGNVLLFQSLYVAKGSLYGYVTIGNGANHPVALFGSPVSWTKNVTADRNYKSGFTPALALVLGEGGLYTPPAANTAVLGLPDSGTSSNAETIFASGGLTPPFSQTFIISPKNVVTVPTGPIFNPRTLTFSIAPATGVFNGTFKIPGTPVRSASFSGVITHRKGDANASKMAGYGFFTLPQALPTATTSPILSGTVLFQGYPSP